MEVVLGLGGEGGPRGAWRPWGVASRHGGRVGEERGGFLAEAGGGAALCRSSARCCGGQGESFREIGGEAGGGASCSAECVVWLWLARMGRYLAMGAVAERHLAGIGLRVGDEVLQRLHRQLRVDHDDHRNAHEVRDRREVLLEGGRFGGGDGFGVEEWGVVVGGDCGLGFGGGLGRGARVVLEGGRGGGAAREFAATMTRRVVLVPPGAEGGKNFIRGFGFGGSLHAGGATAGRGAGAGETQWPQHDFLLAMALFCGVTRSGAAPSGRPGQRWSAR